ncbi:MAG: PD40 domain-containing protein [Candidatus Aminicenantes bacterium]|nr:PD40 domain-containing protein [Candidatus Aminicenantes bacterium]
MPIGWEVNSNRWERGPSISDNGNLYFCSMRAGGFGHIDLYCSKFVDGKYLRPENLGSVLNTEGYESYSNKLVLLSSRKN